MGVDCFAPLGTPLVAVEAGWIRYATPGDPFDCTSGGDISGNRVSLRGRSGYVYYYGHLDTILVATDQPVEKGQVIGTVGQTGNAACSTPHLHVEVKCGDNGTPFDPYPSMAHLGPGQPSSDALAEYGPAGRRCRLLGSRPAGSVRPRVRSGDPATDVAGVEWFDAGVVRCGWRRHVRPGCSFTGSWLGPAGGRPRDRQRCVAPVPRRIDMGCRQPGRDLLVGTIGGLLGPGPPRRVLSRCRSRRLAPVLAAPVRLVRLGESRRDHHVGPRRRLTRSRPPGPGVHPRDGRCCLAHVLGRISVGCRQPRWDLFLRSVGGVLRPGPPRRVLSRCGPRHLASVLGPWIRLVARLGQGRRDRHFGPGRRVTWSWLRTTGVRARPRPAPVPVLLERSGVGQPELGLDVIAQE